MGLCTAQDLVRESSCLFWCGDAASDQIGIYLLCIVSGGNIQPPPSGDIVVIGGEGNQTVIIGGEGGGYLGPE